MTFLHWCSDGKHHKMSLKHSYSHALWYCLHCSRLWASMAPIKWIDIDSNQVFPSCAFSTTFLCLDNNPGVFRTQSIVPTLWETLAFQSLLWLLCIKSCFVNYTSQMLSISLFFFNFYLTQAKTPQQWESSGKLVTKSPPCLGGSAR